MSQRTCVGTVQRIIAAIPPGEPLRADLENFVAGVFLELPETSHTLWAEAARIMQRHIGNAVIKDTSPAWQLPVERIWFGKEPVETP